MAVESVNVSLGDFVLLDDLFRLRAADSVQVPLMGIHKSEATAKPFELLTGQHLNRFIDNSAKHYVESNLRVTSTKTVGILGPSDLDWIVSVFGLVRAGYTVLTLSPRLSPPAVRKLLDETDCQCVLYGSLPYLHGVITEIASERLVQSLPILLRSGYDYFDHKKPYSPREIDRNEERKNVVVIMHSSGSTGLPKPIYTRHNRYTLPALPGPGSKDLMTLPLYHAFAFTVSVQRMYHRKTIYFPSPNLPLTCETLTAAIGRAQPAVLHAVPYVLKILAEERKGVEVLKTCEEVISAGSQCPDELGDRLVDQGIKLATYFASTETALLGTSQNRPPGDNAWAYIRPSPALLKHIWPKPLGDGTYEFVYLRDYPSLVTSNSLEPPGSYHSKDIFSPHPDIPGAWKHIGRIDDRVTLLNGEKILPLAMEGRVQEHPLVRAAVVFGISRPIPGMLVFRAEAARSMGNDEFVTKIYPAIRAANLNAEGFSKIGRNMVVPLAAEVDIPLTDKGSLIRALIYQKFKREIECAYNNADSAQEGDLKLELPALEEYLFNASQAVTGIKLSDSYTDFFRAGMDSLQALQLRTQICNNLDLGGKSGTISQNIIYETANISNLAQFLYSLSHDQEHENENPVDEMSRMVEKYSHFRKCKPSPDSPARRHFVVFLTGATGNVGSHILGQLLKSSRVDKVFCLVRGKDPISRLHESMKDRGLSLSEPAKLSILTGDLSHQDLKLSPGDYSEIVSCLTHIIHCAWPVNFQLGLPSFEPHIAGVQSLLQMSLAVPNARPARFIFCSSITSVICSPETKRIPEVPLTDLSISSSLGYGRSKLVAEHVVHAAVDTVCANATILRIGQIVGDQEHGTWNDNEMIPMIVHSGLTMGTLPVLDLKCEWLPVDTLAEIILELSGISIPGANSAKQYSTKAPTQTNTGEDQDQPLVEDSLQSKELVYNIRSPHTFSWTSDFLPALTRAGLKYKSISFSEWLEQIQSLPSDSTIAINNESAEGHSLVLDIVQNPAIKLLEYLKTGFLEDSKYVIFEISKAERDSPALRKAPMVVESGLVDLMVKWWMRKWTETDRQATSSPRS